MMDNVNSPIISVIIPIYNVEEFLPKCIDSVLNQTLKNVEIILVDDGSTDNSSIICDEYALLDNRITVIHKKNEGLSASRNIGIDVAKGNYLAFVDSDDWIEESMFEIMYNTIVTNDADMVVCNYYEDYGMKSYIPKVAKAYYSEKKCFNNVQALEQLYKINWIFSLSWNKLYRKRLFGSFRYKEKVCFEDEFIIHNLLFKCNKVIYLPQYFYHYYQREGSILHSKFNVSRLDQIEAIRQQILFYRSKKLIDLSHMAEKKYGDVLIWSYFVAKKQIENVDYELRKLRKKFIKIYGYILFNPLFSKKNKIMLGVFLIMPNIYERITRII
ncbi:MULTISPECIES: glycosyltransferase family 2 protein [unclassified Clostridium]|uniref:glycosyltransferase family 2 protein n=1 Tax=unclassified Clostridium TaxID=2614128 RepID=UPI003216E81A